MNDDLRDRLRRLGVHRGLEPSARTASRRQAVPGTPHALLGGREIQTPNGPAYVIEKQFELDYVHGDWPLASALSIPGGVPGLPVDLARAAFIDTETTGLAGGTGTLAFLIGVGRFSNARFQICQFFIRQPGEEAATLTALAEAVADCPAVVTFNGRGFDMPLLQTRYTLARMFPAILTAPNLDLLEPARRLWRDRLSSCALSSLETHVLGVRRDRTDVPGFLIPQIYFDYLKTGDASELPGVLYHNAQDILSLVTLAARLGHILAAPLADAALDPVDLASLARWYDDLGMSGEAEAALRAALERPLPADTRAVAWRRLALLLKRQGRYDEAARAWERLAALGADVGAHVELAKHYEWRERDLGQALAWTEAALAQIKAWPPGPVRDQAHRDLAHRRERLARKSVKRET